MFEHGWAAFYRKLAVKNYYLTPGGILGLIFFVLGEKGVGTIKMVLDGLAREQIFRTTDVATIVFVRVPSINHEEILNFSC